MQCSPSPYPQIEKLAKKHNCEGANILISWQVARGANVLPKSVTASRIANNLKREWRVHIHGARACAHPPSLLPVVDLSDDEVAELEKQAAAQPFKKVCDQSEDFEYDIYEADHPQNNDKAQANL